MGPIRGELLKKELGVFTFGDLLELYPFRHIDKTQVNRISDINYNTEYIQVAGRLQSLEVHGERFKKRLVGELRDSSGNLELVWFQGASWVEKSLEVGKDYLVFGKAGFFNGSPQITHPEIELLTPNKKDGKNFLEPIYPSTEKLKARSLGGRQIGKLTLALFELIKPGDLVENLPEQIISELQLVSRFESVSRVHFPGSPAEYQDAVKRLKFEELFLAQLRLGLIRIRRHTVSRGPVFRSVGELFNIFYRDHLPFELTGAQKRVLKEIRKDTAQGRQMNRLLQGDVGSGKTIVALLSVLLAMDNGFQACIMAPTEILARQHFETISKLLAELPVQVKLLTGSSKSAARKDVLEKAADGSLNLLIGTHALIEETVQFANLGFAVIDEQHRFGVAQRAKLWKKATLPPHVLVMTATPIPRTLAMTAYGDLDYSVIDELPPGRIPINTVHRLEDARPQVMDFIKEEIKKGRQSYIIFPLIEESEKMDYENLMTRI